MNPRNKVSCVPLERNMKEGNAKASEDLMLTAAKTIMNHTIMFQMMAVVQSPYAGYSRGISPPSRIICTITFTRIAVIATIPDIGQMFDVLFSISSTDSFGNRSTYIGTITIENG